MQNLQLADGGKRFLAYLIDIIILSIVSLILFGVLFAVGGLGVAASAEGGDAATAGMMAAIIGAGALVQVLLIAVQIGYFAFMEASDSQATIGKRAMGLIVADEEGNRLTMQKALIRNLLKVITGFICFLIYLTAFFTDKKQAVHDMINKSNVYTK